ncbi:MAG: Spy/CpxP family protein refolding chaperone [Candidatus Sericytochromatia bacterium]
MKKLFKIGSGILTLAFMTACGNSVVSDASNLSGSLSFAADKQTVNGVAGKKGDRGNKGAFAKDFLNLTDDQKTKLQELRDSLFPKPDATVTDDTRKANAEAAKTAFKDAFLADTIDVASLKAKLESLKPANVDSETRIKAQAEYMIKSYAILTAEQKATLETKQTEMEAKRAEMEANRPTVKPSPDASFNPADKMIENLATKLTLTEDQKTKLKAVFEANKPAQPDTATMDANRAKMEANRKAIQASIKDGTATVDSVVALLKADKPEVTTDHIDSHLNTIVQVHDILTADQRKIAVDLPMIGIGFGGKGGHEGNHKMGGDIAKGFAGGKGGEGFKGSKGGFGLPF